MRTLLGTVLCVGLAACSHDRPAESASNMSGPSVYDASTTREPSMTPASAENAPVRGAAAADANRRSAGTLQPDMSTRAADTAAPNRAGADTSASNRDARDVDAAPSTIGADESRSGSTTAGASAHPSKSTGPTTVAPDNTKVNERDRDAQSPTPTKQGNDQSDLKITQQIRKAVMSDKSLSFTAKNVKIITSSGHVVLRGTVKTDAERAAIEDAARKVAGDGQVENQIEVKQ